MNKKANKKIKGIAGVAIGALMVASLAACGGSSQTAETEAAETEAAAQAETEAAAESEAAETTVEETTKADTSKTFVTEDGVMSITVPNDGDDWKVVDDPAVWFAIADGTDAIMAMHYANDDQVPERALAADNFKEVYEVFYSTENEVFVISGTVQDVNDMDAVRDAVNSFEILKYNAPLPEIASLDVYSINAADETLYCTAPDGVNIRQSYTTNSPALGLAKKGDSVHVTGHVFDNDEDTGWLQIDYNGQNAYVWGEFFSAEAPAVETTTSAENETAAPATDEVDKAARELALSRAGEGAVVISSELKEGTLGGYTGQYYRIGVRDANGNVTYYNGKSDFVYTDEEVEEINKEYSDQESSEAPPVADDIDAAVREMALQQAGEGAVVISSESMEGTIGGYTGQYYRVGVRDANGNVTYYNGKSDFIYTDAEVESVNADYDN